MTTIKDIIATNDNVQIRIQRMQRNDPFWPSYDAVWEGLLHDIPEELLNAEVVEVGWLMGAKLQSLTLPPDQCHRKHRSAFRQDTMVR